MASTSTSVRRCSDVAALALMLAAGSAVAASQPSAPHACAAGTVYLTLDTGSMRHAELIADILARRQVKATFFVAGEKTVRGDRSLDDAWAPYWRARVAEGHAFGSHTLDHVYFRGDARDAQGNVVARAVPQFGENAGRELRWDAQAVCGEIRRADERFRQLTGRGLDPLWRAPGGRAPGVVMRAAAGCGYSHVHWAAAGFLGDELPSETHPNDQLLARALRGVRDGDVLMAHLGIWSRRDPFAPMLEPLIRGLQERGFCFGTLPAAKTVVRSPGESVR